MRTNAPLTAIDAEVEATRTELGYLQDRLAQVRAAAEDALIRALVAETPIAHREERLAREALERTRRLRDETLGRLLALRVERDRLRGLAELRR